LEENGVRYSVTGEDRNGKSRRRAGKRRDENKQTDEEEKFDRIRLPAGGKKKMTGEKQGGGKKLPGTKNRKGNKRTPSHQGGGTTWKGGTKRRTVYVAREKATVESPDGIRCGIKRGPDTTCSGCRKSPETAGERREEEAVC